MECEICGKETDEVRQIDLEGTTLIVCSACASYGKEIERDKMPFARRVPLPARPVRPPKEEKLDLGVEIVLDYGGRVRKARQAKQLTVKELAMKIFEKESLLHRIENQSIKPSDQIIAKLENQLGIKLKEKKAGKES